MGGIGSGRWYRWGAGPVVEDGLTLDLNRLIRQGLVGPHGGGGTLTWRKVPSGDCVASIGYNVLTYGPGDVRLALDYTVERDGAKRSVRETARLQVTGQHFGGERWWLTCPACGRRAAKLYTRQGADLFLCRGCHGLSYASQRESPMFRTLSQAQKIRMNLGGSGATVDPFPDKPKGMHWRTYRRLRRKAIRYEGRSNMLMVERFGIDLHNQ